MLKSHHIACIIWITIGLIAIAIEAVPVDENEIKKGRECKTFCDRCGCIGFYCGEECICECNQEQNGGDTECIAAIQANAKQNKTPFEILIQGPSANRFLRNALQFDQNQQTCSTGDYGRSKRSTVVIYKPVSDDSSLDGFCERPLNKDEEILLEKNVRAKRSLGDNWFTDFSNTLVKPAPIAGMSVDAEDIEETVEEPEAEEETTTDIETETETETGTIDDDKLIPKIRELRKEVKSAFNIGENDSIVKGIRKTFTKIGDKALKAVELDGAVKKIRGAITNFVGEESEQSSSGRKIFNKIRGKILQPFGDDEELES